MKGRICPKTVLLWLIAILVCGSAAAASVVSLGWRPAHDAPVVLYPAYLAWTGQKVPYKDLFDFNFPGTYAIYGLLGAVTDFIPWKLQLANLLLLIAGGFVSALLWPKGARVGAIIGYSAFACLFFDWYSEFGLQREFFWMLLLLAACAVGVYRGSAFWVGFLAGCAILVKPTSIIAFFAVVIWLLPPKAEARDRVRLLAYWSTGLALPLAAAAAWLVHIDALSDFIDITRNYTPLYAAMNGAHRTLQGSDRISYLLRHIFWPDGDVKWIAVATIAVVALAWPELNSLPKVRRIVELLSCLSAVLLLYPALSGQFWRYHYLPFLGFSFILLSTGLLVLAKQGKWTVRSCAGASISLGIFLYVSNCAMSALKDHRMLPTQRVADEVTAFLTKHLKPNDTVQPLDWTGGMVEGMLNSRARLATSFFYDFEFYHSVSDPYIAGLRRRLIVELKLTRPNFVLERLGEEKPWPSGPGTSREFPELREFLDQNYMANRTTREYTIWVRKNQAFRSTFGWKRNWPEVDFQNEVNTPDNRRRIPGRSGT